MIFPWPAVASFFTAILLAAWFLYPSDYFLGLMRRQQPDRTAAQRSLKDYLLKHPYHKRATLALAEVYESIADPETAVALVDGLYKHRRGDPEIGRELLELLDRAGHLRRTQAFRWQLCQDLRGKPAPKGFVENLLYEQYQQALLSQDQAGELEALQALSQSTRDPTSYRYAIMRYYADRREFPKLNALLEKNLKLNPKDADSRIALAQSYGLVGKSQAAIEIISAGIALEPDRQVFLDARAGFYEEQGLYTQALPDLKRLAALTDGKRALLRRLAYAQIKSGREEEAAALYESLVARRPRDKESWWDLVYLYVQLKRRDEAIKTLERFMARFPNDSRGIEELTYLYEEKGDQNASIAALQNYMRLRPEDKKMGTHLAALLVQADRLEEARDVYGGLIRRYPEDRELWWELISSYADLGRGPEAAQWLKRFLKRFPDDFAGVELLANQYEIMGDTQAALATFSAYTGRHPDSEEASLDLVDLLTDSGRYQEAEQVALQRLKAHPEDASWLLIAAQIYSSLGRSDPALRYYRRWLATQGNKPEALKRVGMESLFAGNIAAARELLSSADRLSPGDPETLFYLAEAEADSGNTARARLRVQEALKALTGSDPETERKRLRLEARLGWHEGLRRRYRALADLRPQDSQVLSDWIEALSAVGYQASEPIALLRERFPREEDKKPELRRAVGEAYLRSGQWRQAENTLARLPSSPNDPYKARPLLSEIHEQYDQTFGPRYRYYQLPTETSHETGLSARGFILDKLSLDLDWIHGIYSVPGVGFKGSADIGLARLDLDSPHLRLGLMGGGSSGSPRNRFSPGGAFRWNPNESFSAQAEHRYHRLWNEFAQAVAFGTLADETQTGLEFRPWPRVYLNSNYQYNHYTTIDGSWADRHRANPAASYALKEKPYLALTYQFVYDEVKGSDSFFRQVPLIRRAHAHYGGLSYSHEWLPEKLRFDAYLYNGQDSGRGLEFFHGDLFGFIIGFTWRPTGWLNVVSDYEYGKESAGGLAGESHTVRLKLDAHWFGYGEKNLPHR